MESELTLYSLGTHPTPLHSTPPKTFKALRVELESSNLEHSFLLEFLAMVPTFKNVGTAGQLSAAVKLSKKLKFNF